MESRCQGQRKLKGEIELQLKNKGVEEEMVEHKEKKEDFEDKSLEEEEKKKEDKEGEGKDKEESQGDEGDEGEDIGNLKEELEKVQGKLAALMENWDVDSVQVLELESFKSDIDLYMVDEAIEVQLPSINVSKCRELEDLAHQLRILWSERRGEIEKFLKAQNHDIQLPMELGIINLSNPWPFFKTLYFAKDESGSMVEMDFFKDASCEHDIYGIEADWMARTGEWVLGNLTRIDFVVQNGY